MDKSARVSKILLCMLYYDEVIIMKILESLPRLIQKLMLWLIFQSVAPLMEKRRLTLAGICKRLKSPGIDSKESIPPAYVAWRKFLKEM